MSGNVHFRHRSRLNYFKWHYKQDKQYLDNSTERDVNNPNENWCQLTLRSTETVRRNLEINRPNASETGKKEDLGFYTQQRRRGAGPRRKWLTCGLLQPPQSSMFWILPMTVHFEEPGLVHCAFSMHWYFHCDTLEVLLKTDGGFRMCTFILQGWFCRKGIAILSFIIFSRNWLQNKSNLFFTQHSHLVAWHCTVTTVINSGFTGHLSGNSE